MLVSLPQDAQASQYHPLFSNADEPHWTTFSHNDALVIDCLYAECNARLLETDPPEPVAGQYSLRIFCTERELNSLVAAAYYACDLKRGAA